MPRHCSACDHAEREAIDLALVEGAAFRDIARRFQLSKDGVSRHKAQHLPVAIVEAKATEEETRSETLIAKVRSLETQARAIGKRAEQAGDLRVALGAVRELARIVELQARLAGELSDAPSVSITLSTDWLSMRATIVAALAPFPDAREAVGRALGTGGDRG